MLGGFGFAVHTLTAIRIDRVGLRLLGRLRDECAAGDTLASRVARMLLQD